MEKQIDDVTIGKHELAKNVIGEIALSDDPSKVIKKWRKLFGVSQKGLAHHLGITSSVISDYESGRRSSPGIGFVRKYVSGLIAIDGARGGGVLKSFMRDSYSGYLSSAVMDMKEFDFDTDPVAFCGAIGAELVTGGQESKIYGYTIIDSVKAITEMSFPDLVKLYGMTTQRALVFTNVTSGKGPMIAIKVANLKPALVILHGIDKSEVSTIAKNISLLESIPLAVCESVGIEALAETLSEFKG